MRFSETLKDVKEIIIGVLVIASIFGLNLIELGKKEIALPLGSLVFLITAPFLLHYIILMIINQYKKTPASSEDRGYHNDFGVLWLCYIYKTEKIVTRVAVDHHPICPDCRGELLRNDGAFTCGKCATPSKRVGEYRPDLGTEYIHRIVESRVRDKFQQPKSI